ncbi:hypothetical protein [Streptacidiphilus cavernicola]|uniref:Peptidase inhibitor family I36 n=1 Tax=Streptacidiphilus cavernicola TaxID=3342716 RepID=A0ABV6VS91_9ACTN
MKTPRALLASPLRLVVAAACALPLTLVGTSAAHADPAVTTKTSPCQAWEVGACLFYNSNGAGATYGFGINVPDLSGYSYSCGAGNECRVNYVFSGGAGSGVSVKNNAASVSNGYEAQEVTVFYNSNFSGPRQDIDPTMKAVNLNSTLKNEDASLYAAPICDC